VTVPNEEEARKSKRVHGSERSTATRRQKKCKPVKPTTRVQPSRPRIGKNAWKNRPAKHERPGTTLKHDQNERVNCRAHTSAGGPHDKSDSNMRGWPATGCNQRATKLKRWKGKGKSATSKTDTHHTSRTYFGTASHGARMEAREKTSQDS
jgi:hypothetical protein